jgi:hypothetical protein
MGRIACKAVVYSGDLYDGVLKRFQHDDGR